MFTKKRESGGITNKFKMNHVLLLILNKKKAKTGKNFFQGFFFPMNNGKTKYTSLLKALRNVIPQSIFI